MWKKILRNTFRRLGLHGTTLKSNNVFIDEVLVMTYVHEGKADI